MSTETETAQDVALAILDGKFDDDLQALTNATEARRKVLRAKTAQMNALFLNPGDKVRLSNLRPQYINGEVVEVVKVNKTRVKVKATDDNSLRVQQRIRMDGGTSVPLANVEKVED